MRASADFHAKQRGYGLVQGRAFCSNFRNCQIPDSQTLKKRKCGRFSGFSG